MPRRPLAFRKFIPGVPMRLLPWFWLSAVPQDPTRFDIAPIPEAGPALRAEVEGGRLFLLTDHQLRWEGEVRQSFNRVVAEVTGRAGRKELATIQLDFYLAHETASLTRLVIHRCDQLIDVLGRLSLQVSRRETRLEEGSSTAR